MHIDGGCRCGAVSFSAEIDPERVIDETDIAVSPVLPGQGERLFDGVDLPTLGYVCARHESSPRAMHLALTRQ